MSGLDDGKTIYVNADGILDSMTIARLIGLLEDEYDIEFEVTDLVPENFNSARAIYALIETLKA